jgi:hypothetical protein
MGMSWFNLGIEGKKYFDQHRSFTSIITGNYLSKILYKNFIKDHPLNTQLRDLAREQLSPVVVSQLMPLSTDAADEILKISVKKEKFRYLSSRLKHHFMKDPKRHLLFIVRRSAHFMRFAGGKVVKSIKNRGDANVISNSGIALVNAPGNHVVKKHLKKGEISDAVHQVVLERLRPICEEAVQKGINSMADRSVAKAYDFSIKKTLSIVVVPFVYSLALAVSETVCRTGSLPCADFSSYLPHPATLLALSAAGNAMQMAGVLWEEITKETDEIDADKEKAKELTIKLTRESVSKKIRENKFLSAIEANTTSEEVEALASLLISEMVDFYWKDLQNKKILGLPLVS